VDCEPDSWNIDPTNIKEKMTENTKTIMPVHIYGHPCNMEWLWDLANKHNLFIIEDCAESHGAEYRELKTGRLSDIAVFSFYGNKIITTGEGGILTTNIYEHYERAQWLKAHAFGLTDRHFYHEEVGFNFRMSGLQASFGLAQLERIDELVEARRTNAEIYNCELHNLAEDGKITLPVEKDYAKNVYWMYSILINEDAKISRDKLLFELDKAGIESRPFFTPIHQQPIYKHLKGEFPVADDISQRGINLPSSSVLTRKQIERVCHTLWALL